MRWTIPTLVQVLVDAGVRPDTAGAIVAETYPTTRGDTFYRSKFADPDLGPAVGVYALWNANRADRVDLTGTKPSDDARTIAQLMRLDPRRPDGIFYNRGSSDAVINSVVSKTVTAIQQGAHFEPAEIPIDRDPGWGQQIAQSIRNADGAWDSLASIPFPRLS